MTEPFLGEIRMFVGTFAPNGWALCNGQTLSVSEYNALFRVIGTRFGGDGINNFAVPDLRGRIPVHVGMGLTLGKADGKEQVALNVSHLPEHNHVLMVSSHAGTRSTPSHATWAQVGSAHPYHHDSGGTGTLNPSTVAPVGEGQMHSNLQPFLCLTFMIALKGLQPTP